MIKHIQMKRNKYKEIQEKRREERKIGGINLQQKPNNWFLLTF